MDNWNLTSRCWRRIQLWMDICSGSLRALLQDKLSLRLTQFAYAEHNCTDIVCVIALCPQRPLKEAMRKRRRAAHSTPKDGGAKEWLGHYPNRWKCVYFIEPDQVLQTRQGALKALGKAWSKGHLWLGTFPLTTANLTKSSWHGLFVALHDVSPL